MWQCAGEYLGDIRKGSARDRQKTMDNVLAADLKLATFLESVGPEHMPEELCGYMSIHRVGYDFTDAG